MYSDLLRRHGQIEHLIVQFDFLVQVERDPRAEFSIPGASKRIKGNVGFADIVALSSKEVWEIKPKHLEKAATDEAGHYVSFAKTSCGPDWQLGKTFRVSDRAKREYGAENIVYRVEARGLRYELVCEQGAPGSVLYFWKLNGREQGALDPSWGWAVRGKVLLDYFGQNLPQALPDARAPNNVPPIKFKRPVLIPDSCMPILRECVPALNEAMLTTCAKHVADGGGVAVLLDEAAFNEIQGATVVGNAIANLQVRSDPQVTLARELSIAVGVSGAIFGLPFFVFALLYIGRSLLILGIRALPAAAPVATGVPSPAMALLTLAIKNMTSRGAIAAGAASVVVAVPRVSQATPAKPVAFDLLPFKFEALKPREMQTVRVGQATKFQGGQHYVVGLARTYGD